ncbi:hypothetical protein I7I48_02698 [Histoplasma ohiense]|nr:hypothetical protein I7I48_02698 [Histoplasma ohiense (nom. inval.)]
MAGIMIVSACIFCLNLQLAFCSLSSCPRFRVRACLFSVLAYPRAMQCLRTWGVYSGRSHSDIGLRSALACHSVCRLLW